MRYIVSKQLLVNVLEDGGFSDMAHPRKDLGGVFPCNRLSQEIPSTPLRGILK
ncbi:MAG TPA: hypothetical protein VKZ39_03100 [Sphaerochaetaceae bacterium]|nr:hypothetical protein [Sphaerochaetaceae bacterium]